MKIKTIDEELDGRFRNEYHRGLINLFYTTRQLHYRNPINFKSFGITEQQYNILKILRGFGSEPRPIEFIKDRMLDKASDISRLIDRLYKKGLVDRVECKKDRRQKDITITEKGLELLKKLDPYELQVDNLLKNLSESEVKQLNKLLDKIRAEG